MNPVNLMQALHKSCAGLHWHEHGVASAGSQRPLRLKAVQLLLRDRPPRRAKILQRTRSQKNDRLELPGLDKNL